MVSLVHAEVRHGRLLEAVVERRAPLSTSLHTPMTSSTTLHLDTPSERPISPLIGPGACLHLLIGLYY
jgi:hypothetical protein